MAAARPALSYKTRLLRNILQNLPVILGRLGLDGLVREHMHLDLRRLSLDQNELVGRMAAEVFPVSDSCR